ncbi:hypothetical protein TB2_005117 [Malus domestica]
MGWGICRDEAELRVENHAADADVADDVEAESNVVEHEKHANLRTQDPPPERSMEAKKMVLRASRPASRLTAVMKLEKESREHG